MDGLRLTRDDKLIHRKMWKIMFSCFLMVAAAQLDNICDNVLSGRLLGIEALATVQLGMSVDSLVVMAATALCVGGNAMISILLGRRKIDEAGRVFTLILFIGLILSTIFIIMGIFCSRIIARLLMGIGPVNDGLVLYIKYALLSSPILCIGAPFVVFASTDNHMKLNVLYTLISISIKITGEYILLKVFHGGVESVPLSSCLGSGLGLLIYIGYFRSEKRMLHIKNPFDDIKTRAKALLDYIKPNTIVAIGNVLGGTLLKAFLIRRGSTDLALYSVIATTEFIVVWMLVGASFKLQRATVGILYGEKDIFGLKRLMKRLTGLSLGIVCGAGLLFCLFPTILLKLLGFELSGITELHTATVRSTCIYCVFVTIYVLAQQYYLFVDQKKIASVLSLLKECIFFFPLPCLFAILASVVGIYYFYGFLAGLVLSAILPLIICFLYIRLKYKGEELWLLPAEDGARTLDISIADTKQDLSELLDTVTAFCESSRLDKKWTNMITLATDEAINSIAEVNKASTCFIDINIRITDNNIFLKIRSDGMPFDPSAYKPEEGEISSLALLQKLASNIQYLYVMYLNNTLYRFDL